MSLAPDAVSPAAQNDDSPLVEVRHLRKFFGVRRGLFARVRQYVHAVDDVSFQIARGRTLGLVGESGCGKTTVGRAILQLARATSGEVLFEGKNVFDMSRHERQKLRGRMQIIFQDPFGSLNPRMTVGGIVAEPLKCINRYPRRQIRGRVLELLEQVGLDAEAANRYPHEFSGGQRQRIGIARAIALNPSFIVCDEPTSALDVSVRAQVINLLEDLQQKHGIAYLMISHDLAFIRYVSHDIAVMYLGRLVEQAPAEELFNDARHPYTRVLLEAVPSPTPRRRKRRITATNDEIPSPIDVPSGCPFHPRCPLYALKGRPEICHREIPPLAALSTNARHQAACHFAEENVAEHLSEAATV